MLQSPRATARPAERKPVSPPHPPQLPRGLERKDGIAELAHQVAPLELKFDAETGEFEGYCSRFGLLDRGGDIMQPGAFKASLASWRKRKLMPPVLWQHDSSKPVGAWTELKEDDVGLWGRGKLLLNIQAGKDARELVAAKIVTGLSIGYVTEDRDYDRTTGARLLKKVELWEISLVTFPMLMEAQVASMKGDLEPKALERALRDEAGLSISEAKAAISVFRKHTLRDAGSVEPALRDGAAEMLMTLRKATQALRD